MPAEAGIYLFCQAWIPAFAGMTDKEHRGGDDGFNEQ
jgi:hypothetical protein